jgi:hypothetical protein
MSVSRNVESAAAPSPRSGRSVEVNDSFTGLGPGRAHSLDETPDPPQRLLEVFVAGRVAGPHVAFARRTERIAGDDGDTFLLE